MSYELKINYFDLIRTGITREELIVICWEFQLTF